MINLASDNYDDYDNLFQKIIINFVCGSCATTNPR